MIIQHNIMSINAHRQLGVNNTVLSKKLEKLSSGYRINVAADDAAGLAISEKMRKQITGLSRAVLNAQDGVSLVQTAEGALQEVHAQLNRLEEMAVQAANGIYGADDRQKMQAETNALLEEFDRISKATNFNGIALLDGSLSKNKSIANAAIAQAPPPFATPIALSAMGGFGAQAAALEGAEQAVGIQPLGAGIGTQSVETIDFNSLKDVDVVGDGWSYSAENKVLTITGSNTYEINGTRVQTDTRIVVRNNATGNITLNNVNIKTDAGAALDMRQGSVNLNITGTNTLVSTALDSAGIQTDSSYLTIDGTGRLTATGGNNGAGIGGGRGQSGGNITIIGGIVTATGGSDGAGIGGGAGGNGGAVTIKGGTVTAKSSFAGAGIGGGIRGNGGSVTISGGTVNASSSESGAGIGGGFEGAGANLLIYGGRVTATGGRTAGNDVGGGMNGAAGVTEIAGGTLNAARVQGNIKSPSGDVTYKVAVSGLSFTPNTDITYTIDGQTQAFRTDPQGTLILYLAATDHGKTLELMYGATKCTGTISVNTPGVGAITLDYERNVGGTSINMNQVQEGQYGDGWKFEGGVLTISGNNNYTINGNGTQINSRIKIESGTNCGINLKDVNIINNADAALFMEDAIVRLNIEGKSELITTRDNCAGIQTTGGTLTINGAGELITSGGRGSAGIGGGRNGAGGSITINSGTVTATGGYDGGAGIGSGASGGDSGTILITGGTVTAKSNSYGAGIGGGSHSNGGSITITGGTITATSSSEGAGIGGGRYGSGGIINISGADITTRGGNGGAGIGGGSLTGGGSGGEITIRNSTVNAKGGDQAAGIGGGYNSSGGDITIYGGEITATGGSYGAGIGGGSHGTGGNIRIEGGTVTASGTLHGAGIGGSYLGVSGEVTITGGVVIAKGGVFGAGIGGGNGAAGGKVSISGGKVAATGGQSAAGIGGGNSTSDGATLTITGGLVEAEGGTASIGGGRSGTTATTVITGGNLSVPDPANTIHGSITNGSNPVYQLVVKGISFGAHEAVSYSFGGNTYTATTDKNGKLFLYLPQSANEGTFTMNYNNVDYTLYALVKADHTGKA